MRAWPVSNASRYTYAFTQGKTLVVQTFTYATWVDANVAEALGLPLISDIVALSHEVQEWINDPLISNVANPPWQYPHLNTCAAPFMEQSLLEVADPISNELFFPVHFPDNVIVYPVTLNGFTYHPQNTALLQWFTQESPSSAIDGAYSYPNESVLTAPSVSCP